MPADTALTRVEGVELARTGVWPLLSGVWRPTRADFAAAVEAAACPAVRNPVLWIGHTDDRYTPRTADGDGTPGVGWIENMRTTDGGHTLVGDYVGLPGWMTSQVMASAWPDRSVEGAYNRRCQLGHRHRFILDGVALLGVTRPGVGPLRSLQTLPEVQALWASADDSTERRISARFDPRQRRDGDGKWTSIGGRATSLVKTADRLKLAGRIKLRAGETLTGSGAVQDADAGRIIAVAGVNGPDGPTLRVAAGVLDEDRRSWRATDRESTVVLDADGIESLQNAFTAMREAADQAAVDRRALAAEVRRLRAAEVDLLAAQHPTKTAARKAASLRRAIEDAEVDVWLADRALADQGNDGGRPDLAALRRSQLSERKAREDAKVAGLRAQLAELDAAASPLPDTQQRALSQVRDDLARAEQAVFDFNDTNVVASGVISGAWGDLGWATWVSHSQVTHGFAVRPADAPDDWAVFDDDRQTELTPAGLAKLQGMVGQMTSTPEVAAAADAQTGAMVALIPEAESAERLAVDGGEAADELHVTLAYLGDASGWDATARQDLIDAVSSSVNGAPVLDGNMFGLAVFNPPGLESGAGRDTCVVGLVGGSDVDAIHTIVHNALDAADVPYPAQHAPWHAHITLQYTEDLGQVAALAARVGPVRFDRLRIALAGQHIDIPLIPDADPDEDPLADPDAAMVAAAAGDRNALKRYWTRGEGLKRWATRKHPWTALYRQLRKHVGSERAKRMASQWFKEVFGIWPGERKGSNPAGPG